MATLGTVEDDDEKNILLTVDGKTINNSSVSNPESKNSHVTIWPAAVDEISSLSLTELLATFSYVRFRFDNASENSARWSFAGANTGYKDTGSATLSLVIDVEFDFLHWDRPFSVSDLEAALRQFLSPRGRDGFEFWRANEVDFVFGVAVDLTADAVIADVFGLLEKTTKLAGAVEGSLSRQDREHSILLRFEFPLAIRTACGQYLLYFAQFLRDLGITADTQIKEEANGVLFGVVPRDEKQALEAIREALAIYLSLPDAPTTSAWESNVGIAASQLLANVQHLRSQLLLAQAVLQAKDASIAALQAEANSLRTRMDLLQYIPEGKGLLSPSPESEPIIEGVLAVKKFDWRFLELNVPELLRRLKRRF